MFKRIGLFLLTNIAVIALISIIIFIIERIFGINITAGVGASNTQILIYSAIVGFSGAFFSLFTSKWMAKKAYGIEPITIEQVSELNRKELVVWNTVQELAEINNIKMPEVGIYQDDEPNAFATGATKNSSLVAVSSGLLDIMDEDAIEGVIGHEMAHILNGDMVTMTLLQGVINTFVVFLARIIANMFDSATDGKFGAFGYMAVNILLQIIFGILASLIVNKFSRYREFKADEGSAIYVGKEKMIAGLKALQKMQPIMVEHEGDNLSSMKISSKKSNGLMKLFSTHPDLEDRIKALEELKI